MPLQRVQPSGGTPTTADFLNLQATWSRLLDPVVSVFNAGDGIPVGSIWMWPTTTAPTKYIVCSGQQILQSQNMALFLVLGTSQNTGGEKPGFFRLPAASGSYTLIIKAVA